MKNLSKICDAADWFDSELIDVLINEIEETPRLHRKQWEFGMIFLTLKKLGMIDAGKTGLSMGGGNERVLYSIARRIKKLTVTDLYESETSWDTARTNNADKFIRSDKPFEVDDEKLEVLNMDMRELKFPDNTFDFCYSSCSIEHIGHYNDFLKHLNEAYRVLKDEGVYVFTTELNFSNETIKDQNNYIFSPDYLLKLLNKMDFTLAVNPDLRITNHESNYPLPTNISKLFYSEDAASGNNIFKMIPHVLLLRGKYPFTSVLLIMSKKRNKIKTSSDVFNQNEFEKTRSFLQAGFDKYKDWIQSSQLTLSPFASLPEGVSPYFLDHSEFFERNDRHANEKTIFHTDYCWLGNGNRAIGISIHINSVDSSLPVKINLRIHKYMTLKSTMITCEQEFTTIMNEAGFIEKEFELMVDDNFSYAVLGKLEEGNCTFDRINIQVSPVNKNSIHAKNKEFDILIINERQ
jgi:SAM-dependent methyltransferase